MIINEFLNPLFKEAHETGRQWAQTSAALFLSPEDANHLESAAKAFVHRLPSTPFDPNLSPDDKLQADSYQKTLNDLDDAEMASVKSEVALRQCEAELADLSHRPPQPHSPTWLTLGGITLFAAALLVSIYDWIHDRISDPYLSGLFALVPSVALGVFVVRSLTHADSPQHRKVGLVAGFGISLATGVLRYALAPDEWLLAIALTLVELCVVRFLDWHGEHLQTRHQEWLGHSQKHDKADRRLDTARQHRDRASKQATQLREIKAKHLEDVTLRSLCFQKLPEIEATLIGSIMAGAYKGIAENQGIKRGVVPLPGKLSTNGVQR